MAADGFLADGDDEAGRGKIIVLAVCFKYRRLTSTNTEVKPPDAYRGAIAIILLAAGFTASVPMTD